VISDDFRGKIALVTGSSRGIGRVIARRFAQLGCETVLNYRKSGGASQQQAETLCSEIQKMGRRALLIQADISTRAAVRDMMRQTKTTYGRLDFLVLNAARAPFKPLEKLLERELKELVATNFLGNLFCVQEALPLLQESSGAVVFISSLGSRFYHPAYPLGSMKAAMECVVRDLAESLRTQKVSVNGICAGPVRTDSLKAFRQFFEELDHIPDDLFVEPEEIADVAMFLCRHESRAILGQTIMVDRGMSNRLHLPMSKT
jgi:enoyl-[acyl-carrier protein] reductase III